MATRTLGTDRIVPELRRGWLAYALLATSVIGLALELEIEGEDIVVGRAVLFAVTLIVAVLGVTRSSTPA